MELPVNRKYLTKKQNKPEIQNRKLSFAGMFTELALRFGDTAKIQSSYQEFHFIFQKV